MTLETLFLIGIITSIAANVSIVVFIAFLAIREVRNWFQKRSAIKQADKDNIAFTIQNQLASGKYKTVQGFFNTRNNDLQEARIIESNNIDPEMKKLHSDSELVVYES